MRKYNRKYIFNDRKILNINLNVIKLFL